MTTLQVAAFILSFVGAVALAAWALSNKIAAGNADVLKQVAGLSQEVAVRNQACLDCSKRIDSMIVPRLEDHEKRLRIVEFGSALQELVSAVQQIHGKAGN